ncbi:MAG: metallophosphoesterase [candidate division KSB1 bacterium]|nr:metallophosphoesterase [candidate division KSB1 bacterium]MDZ7304372.1 metallophosphoesterase [candidate division KSB1 bacterium]MDZ7313521.1 metallophosphoesterase [candidate division KSB1 bacterium]
MPSGSSLIIRQLIIQAIYWLIQFAIYRILRSQFGDTAFRRTIIIAAMIAVNLPWLYVSVRMMIYHQPPHSYTLLVTIFGWFMLSLIYLLYFGIIRSGYALWEVAKPVSLSSAAGATAALTRRAFLQKATIGFGAVALITSARGLWLARGTPRLERITLHLPDLPVAFDGVRIVQLSDFHSGPYMSRDQMLSVRRLVEELKPDLYVLTGDFVDAFPEQVPPFVEAFENLRAPLGVFSVLGNHDYFADIETVEAGLIAAGLPFLRNTSHVLEYHGDQLAIVGVDDLWASRRNGRGPNIAAAIKDLPENMFKICLSHQPGYWPEIKKHNIALTLCGHTHGGQFGIVGTQISLARIAGPYVAGLYTEDGPGRAGMQLYVNRGLGVFGLPLRIGMPPEITEVTLKRRG